MRRSVKGLLTKGNCFRRSQEGRPDDLRRSSCRVTLGSLKGFLEERYLLHPLLVGLPSPLLQDSVHEEHPDQQEVEGDFPLHQEFVEHRLYMVLP